MFILLLAAFYFLDYFISARTMLSVNINPDFLSNDYPLTHIAISMLKKGIFPLWNPFIMCGTPLFASSIAVLSVFSLPHFLLPMPAAYMAALMIQVFCAGIFMFFYLFKGLKLSWNASLLGGSLYMFSPLFLIMLPHYGADAPTLALLPLVVLLFELCMARRSLAYALFTALALAACLYSDTGYQYIYACLFIFLYTLLRFGRREIAQNLLFLFVVFFVSFMLSAARIFPTIQALGLSHRGADHPQEGLFISNLLGIIFPFGPIRIGVVEIGTLKNAFLYYAGIITLPLAFVGATMALKDRFARVFFCLAAGLLIFLAFLRYTPLKLWLSGLFPLFSVLAFERLNLFYHFIIISLAAIGYVAIEQNTAKKESLFYVQKIIKWLMIFYFGLFILFVFFWVANGVLRHYLLSAFSGFLSRYHMGKLVYIYQQLFAPSFALLAASSLGVRLALLYTLRQFIKGAQIMVIVFCLFTAFDLMLIARLFINPYSYDYSQVYQAESRENAFLRTIKPVDRMAVKVNYYAPDFEYTGRSVEHAKENPDVGPYNLGLNYDIPVVFGASLAGGTDAMYTKRLGEFVRAAHKNDQLNYQLRCYMNKGRHAVEFTSIDSKLVDLAGIRYIFSIKPLPNPKLRLLFKGAQYYVYENKNVLAKASFPEELLIVNTKEEALSAIEDDAFDPSHKVVVEESVELGAASGVAQAEVISYKPNNVVISGYSDSDRFLLLADAYYPGWRAYIDSRPVKIYRADYIFRGIIFPKGRHRVEFVYRPGMFIAGLAVSLLSLCGVILLTVYILKRNRHVREE